LNNIGILRRNTILNKESLLKPKFNRAGTLAQIKSKFELGIIDKFIDINSATEKNDKLNDA